jgi:hypothetical protein
VVVDYSRLWFRNSFRKSQARMLSEMIASVYQCARFSDSCTFVSFVKHKKEIDEVVKSLMNHIDRNRHLSSFFRRNQESRSRLGELMDDAKKNFLRDATLKL